MDNLTKEEKNVVYELRKRTINEVTSKMLEDESVFYRFAKARDFNLVEAEAMLRKHISWRKDWKIDTILSDYEPPELMLKYGGSSFVCFDKEGSIVRIQDLGRLDVKGYCHSATKLETAKFCVFLAELDKSSVIRKGGNCWKPIFSPIYDLDELTYSNSINIKALQDLVYCVKTLIDNYPESIRFITVINAPVYFAWIYAGITRVVPATVTQKIRIYGKEGWKEALLKDIEADDLPAYLGGNRTDPDGNPLCETFIQRGRPIPKSYYKQNQKKRLALAYDAEKILVKPFSKEEISFDVNHENSYLMWEFEINKGDIEFSLKFSGNISGNLENVELIPKQRTDTAEESKKGCFKCERIGVYTIVFDNSYSWLQTKEVYYRVELKHSKNNDHCEST